MTTKRPPQAATAAAVTGRTLATGTSPTQSMWSRRAAGPERRRANLGMHKAVHCGGILWQHVAALSLLKGEAITSCCEREYESMMSQAKLTALSSRGCKENPTATKFTTVVALATDSFEVPAAAYYNSSLVCPPKRKQDIRDSSW